MGIFNSKCRNFRNLVLKSLCRKFSQKIPEKIGGKPTAQPVPPPAVPSSGRPAAVPVPGYLHSHRSPWSPPPHRGCSPVDSALGGQLPLELEAQHKLHPRLRILRTTICKHGMCYGSHLVLLIFTPRICCFSTALSGTQRRLP